MASIQITFVGTVHLEFPLDVDVQDFLTSTGETTLRGKMVAREGKSALHKVFQLIVSGAVVIGFYYNSLPDAVWLQVSF